MILEKRKKTNFGYYKSKSWKKTRKRLYHKAGYRCFVCRGVGKLHVHHMTYERFTEERDEDLVVLCEECHAALHSMCEPKTPDWNDVLDYKLALNPIR